jgi:hypothetical protein
MRTRIGKALFTGAAAALAIGFTASTALATSATTLTVKVTGGGTYTASSTKTTLTDNGVSVTCTGSKAGGTISTKTYTSKPAPVKVGTSSSLSFTGCTGPLGAVTVKVSGLPYSVEVDSATNSKGETAGIVAGANTAVSMTGCSFNVTGEAPGYYNNSKHTLNLTSTPPVKLLTKNQRLTVSNVNGCAGLVNNGDHPTYTSTYTVSRKIVITSKTG